MNGVFVLPGPRSSAWPSVLALAPNLCFPALAPNLYLTALAPNFLFTDPSPKFLFTGLGQCGAWAGIYQSCPPTLYLLVLAYDFYYRALNLHLSIVVAVTVVILAIVVIS